MILFSIVLILGTLFLFHKLFFQKDQKKGNKDIIRKGDVFSIDATKKVVYVGNLGDGSNHPTGKWDGNDIDLKDLKNKKVCVTSDNSGIKVHLGDAKCPFQLALGIQGIYFNDLQVNLTPQKGFKKGFTASLKLMQEKVLLSDVSVLRRPIVKGEKIMDFYIEKNVPKASYGGKVTGMDDFNVAW